MFRKKTAADLSPPVIKNDKDGKEEVTPPVDIPPLLQELLDRIATFPEPRPFQYLQYVEEEEDYPLQPDSDDEQEIDEEAELAAERKEEEEMKERDKEKMANRPKNDRLGVGTDFTEAHRQFKIYRREVRSMRDGALNNIETELEIKEGTPLVSSISSFGIQYNMEQEKLLFGRIANHYFLPVERLMAFYDTIQNYAYPSEDMKKLRDWLTPEYHRQKAKLDLMISKGKITYDGLWYLFKADGKVFARSKGDMIVGAKITARSYANESFSITGKSVKSNGEVYFEVVQPYSISKFRGMMDIAELRVQPMTDDMLKILYERGRSFKKITAGHHYRQYKGFLMVQKLWGMNYIIADGRVMVDLKTFGRMNPNYNEFNNPGGINTLAQLAQQRQVPGQTTFSKLHRDIYFMTWPTVAGFSFSCKTWGELRVDSITKIQYDDQAYGRLVLPSDKKHLVQALVDQHNKSGKKKASEFSDLISGKGGGCIFLLNGPPGTGKTLTAEAIAEYLHLPLYSISVGELGTNTKDLETKLQDILELASIWNSVVLMDEADIFLEKRSDNDVVRNAMVIFKLNSQVENSS
eukprot:TRINITY_DN1277_c0_g3_i3.p1 TRINITY_DN1277_c0_g3~~TRINITY_DN1277_c0_g3_i3.p1  ORF type:complete len:578 (+),score=211.97 TRINITY_DN1277_c0_g3_i3:1-1734(+)